MKTIFLTDIDGTLIKTGTPIHERVHQAVDNYMARGGYFALVTGRAKSAAEALARELRVNAPCLLLGGALCYDFEGDRPVWSITLDPRVDDLIGLVWRQYPEVSITIYTEGRNYNLRTNDRLLNKGVLEDRTAPLTDRVAVTQPLMKVLFTCDQVSVLQEIDRLHVDQELFSYAAASRHFYELTARQVSKGTAADRLCRHLVGEGDYRLIVAGDAHTDLTMRPFADRFYAPVTAQEEIRQAADECFPEPIEGGLAQVIARHTPPGPDRD